MKALLFRSPVLLWAIALNVFFTGWFLLLPNHSYFLITHTNSWLMPWQLVTGSFTNVGGWWHLALNVLATLQLAPRVLAHYRTADQAKLLLYSTGLIGALMVLGFQFYPGAAGGYSGVVMLLCAFYVRLKLPSSAGLMVQIVVLHALAFLLDWPLSFIGHAAGWLVGECLFAYLPQRPLVKG